MSCMQEGSAMKQEAASAAEVASGDELTVISGTFGCRAGPAFAKGGRGEL